FVGVAGNQAKAFNLFARDGNVLEGHLIAVTAEVVDEMIAGIGFDSVMSIFAVRVMIAKHENVRLDAIPADKLANLMLHRPSVVGDCREQGDLETIGHKPERTFKTALFLKNDHAAWQALPYIERMPRGGRF